MEKYSEEKLQVIEAGKQMLRNGWVVGTWGNISIRTEDGKCMVITPSGVDYELITPESMCVIDLKGNLVTGVRPSIESELHLKIYQTRADVNAVIHTHSTYASALAALRITVPPVFDEMAQIIGGEIRTAEYALPGSRELADHCVKTLGNVMAVLLANHGAVCVAENLPGAFKICHVLEKVLESYILARSVGEPVVLKQEDVAFMRDYFTNVYDRQ
ncbi:MAG: class II aldolase/adducin family protein [Peptococcaceae bacterium]